MQHRETTKKVSNLDYFDFEPLKRMIGQFWLVANDTTSPKEESAKNKTMLNVSLCFVGQSLSMSQGKPLSTTV